MLPMPACNGTSFGHAPFVDFLFEEIDEVLGDGRVSTSGGTMDGESDFG